MFKCTFDEVGVSSGACDFNSTRPVRHALSCGQRFGLRPNRHLDDTVLALTEEVIGLGDAVQGKGVRQQRAQIKPAMPHQLHQAAHALLSARAERGDNPVVTETGGEWLERHRQFPGIDAEARRCSVVSERILPVIRIAQESEEGRVGALPETIRDPRPEQTESESAWPAQA